MLSRRFVCTLSFVFPLLATACQPPPDHAVQLSPVVAAYVEAWNTGNLDDLDSVVTDNFERRSASSLDSDAASLEELKGVIGTFRAAFPDTRVTIDEVHYFENGSVARWSYTATHTGESAIGPPTGQQVSVSGVSWTRYEDGKMVDESVFFDSLSYLTQLGYTVTPPATEGDEGR